MTSKQCVIEVHERNVLQHLEPTLNARLLLHQLKHENIIKSSYKNSFSRLIL